MSEAAADAIKVIVSVHGYGRYQSTGAVDGSNNLIGNPADCLANSTGYLIGSAQVLNSGQPPRGGVSMARTRLGPPFPIKRKCRFFFLISTTGARVLHRFLRPVTPWPGCQRSPAVQKRPRPPANPRLASRSAARRRISGCGALAFFLASESVPSRSINFLPRRQDGSPGNGATTA